MGRRKNGADQDDGGKASTTEGHNSKARAKTIKEAIREIAALESERQSISEQIREIKQVRIKGDLDMKIADFNAAMRLYKLEDEARDTFLDTLRETFEALGLGKQLDFIDAMRAEPEDSEPGYTAELGRTAAQRGLPASDNPHPAGSPEHTSWAAGHADA